MRNDLAAAIGLAFSLAVLGACGKPDAGAQTDSTAAIATAATGATTSTEDCGVLLPYLEALPKDETLASQPLTNRSCRQPTSVSAQYGESDGVTILIDVMDSTKIDMPGGGQLLQVNLDGATGLMKILRVQIQTAALPGASLSDEDRKTIPADVKLTNGQDMVIHYSGGWTGLAVVNGKYILKIELMDPNGTITDTEQAKARIVPIAEKINFSALP